MRFEEAALYIRMTMIRLFITVLLLIGSPVWAIAQVENKVHQANEVEIGYIQNGGYISASTGVSLLSGIFYVGIGTGVRVWDATVDSKPVSVMMPLFLQGKFTFGNSGNVHPFVDLRGGLISDLTMPGTGTFFRSAVGCSYKRFGFKVGYEFMMCGYRDPTVHWPEGADKFKDPYYISGYSTLGRGKNSSLLGITYSF